MNALSTTIAEKLPVSPDNSNHGIHRVHRFALVFAQKVSTKIELSLSSYNHIDRSILKKYFAPEKLLFCQLSWCFIPATSGMSRTTFYSVVEALAIIEMYLRSSMLHRKVMNQRDEKNTQMILFGDMLISACVNQSFCLKNPVLRRELNLLAYRLGLKNINSSLKQTKTSDSNTFTWMDWLGFIPKLVAAIDDTNNKNTSRITAVNTFFTNLAKKMAPNTLQSPSMREASLNPLLAIVEDLPPEMSSFKRTSFSALMFQFFSTVNS